MKVEPNFSPASQVMYLALAIFYAVFLLLAVSAPSDASPAARQLKLSLAPLTAVSAAHRIMTPRFQQVAIYR
jgi:hypothetical protein